MSKQGKLRERRKTMQAFVEDGLISKDEHDAYFKEKIQALGMTWEDTE